MLTYEILTFNIGFIAVLFITTALYYMSKAKELSPELRKYALMYMSGMFFGVVWLFM